jgi:AAA domain-containing protein
MSEQPATKFDAHFQKCFVAFMLRDSDFLSQVAADVNHEHFADEFISRLVLLIKHHFDRHKAAPDELIYRILQNSGMKPELQQLCSEAAKLLFAIPLQNKGYLLAEFGNFLKWTHLSAELPEIVSLARAGKLDGSYERLQKLLDYRPQRQQQVSAPKLVDLSTVTPRCVLWFWPQRIALGKLTIIAGEPGLGKSYLSMWLIAQATTGRPWPGETNGTLNIPGSAVLLSAEDDLEDTIAPRLTAAGADLQKVVALQGVEFTSEQKLQERCFSLERDLPALEQAIDNKPDCRLVVVDPVSAYTGKTDSHKNAEVRGLLAPLSELAARKRVAVVAITHLNKSSGKNAAERVTGSGAFVAAARAAWIVSRDKNCDHDRKLFLPIKNNLAKDNDGLAFRLLQSPSNSEIAIVNWEEGAVETTADEAVSENGEDSQSALEKCREWLATFLYSGRQTASDVEAMSVRAGLSWKTIKNAAHQLRVKKVRVRFGADGKSYWELPPILAQEPVPQEEGKVWT